VITYVDDGYIKTKLSVTHLSNPTVTHLRPEIVFDSFYPEGFVGIGVPIGMDTFVRNFVVKTCRNIIDDVEKLDTIQDGFIHFQLLRFARPPDSSTSIHILCLIIVVFFFIIM
jgi:hypothetical protein